MPRLDEPFFTSNLNRALLDEDTYETLHDLLASSEGQSSLPEVWALRTMGTLGGKHKENFDHTLQVVAACPPRLICRLIALFHDVGKPLTRSVDSNEVTFMFHEDRGAVLARNALKRLGYDKPTISTVSTAVGMSGRLSGYSNDLWTDAAVRRFAREADGFLDELLDFVAVDCTSKHQRNHERVRAQVDAYRQRLADVREKDREAARRPLLNGAQIMSILDVGPGPIIGEVQRALLAENPTTMLEARQIVARFA